MRKTTLMAEMDNTPDLIRKYFPQAGETALEKLNRLPGLYREWNQKINVISRKDIQHIHERHILHSLSIARLVSFREGTKILDVGTGGGFPGIPLAIMFPEVHFHLVDSVGKKIKVVEAIASELKLKNVVAEQARAEKIQNKYDFVVSRAVTNLPKFFHWMQRKTTPRNRNKIPNGIIYLKGGDFEAELQEIPWKKRVYTISDFFEEPFFETKKNRAFTSIRLKFQIPSRIIGTK
ncbi:MAG: 16S rRNA (guanine(527)-N(7))-methyltransferase RsmG [Bacteroidales bacterium]|nr:16S rRNA (guanine(527)-N(7))-methyltransferase RsmG [Bacteroidales bacterium]